MRPRRYYSYVLDVRRVPAREGTFFLPIDHPFTATHLGCVSRFPTKMTIKVGRRNFFDGEIHKLSPPTQKTVLPLLVPLRIRRGSVVTLTLANQLRTRRWNRVQVCLHGSITL